MWEFRNLMIEGIESGKQRKGEGLCWLRIQKKSEKKQQQSMWMDAKMELQKKENNGVQWLPQLPHWKRHFRSDEMSFTLISHNWLVRATILLLFVEMWIPLNHWRLEECNGINLTAYHQSNFWLAVEMNHKDQWGIERVLLVVAAVQVEDRWHQKWNYGNGTRSR